MALQALSAGDITKRLRKAGIAGQVVSSQAMEAFKLYVRSELPSGTDELCKPLFIRDKVLVVQTSSAAMMQALKDHQDAVIQFVQQSTGMQLERIQFRVG